MTNPFTEMNKWSTEKLADLSAKQLIDVQRTVLFPSEQILFDANAQLSFKENDPRSNFFDFTDRLIVEKEI